MAIAALSRLSSAGRGFRVWLTGGSLSLQVVAVAAGSALALVHPPGPHWVFIAVIPVTAILVVHPSVQTTIRRFVRSSRHSPSPQDAEPAPRPEGFRAPAAKLHRDHAPSENTFLRSFDRLEEIFQEALLLEIGPIAEEFALREKVSHLEATGFLTAADRLDWAESLAVRRALLLSATGLEAPPSEAVERALARMFQLQVRLTDRRRILFDAERRAREREDAALLQLSETLD